MVSKMPGCDLIGRPHLDHFHQEKLISANIDLKVRLIPNTNAYLLKTIAPEHDDPQVKYKVKIMETRLFIRTKPPTFIKCTCQIEFDKVYQVVLPDVLIVAMGSDTDMSAGYQANPF